MALPACAAVQVYTTPLGNLDPADAGFFDAIVAKKTQPFEDIGTFDLTVSALTDVAAHIGVNGKGNYSPGALSLYEGIPGSGTLIETQALTYDKSTKEYVAGFNDVLLAPDPYFAVIDGMANVKNLGVSGSVMTVAVPELSTWAMSGVGFAGIGLIGLSKRRNRMRYAF